MTEKISAKKARLKATEHSTETFTLEQYLTMIDKMAEMGYFGAGFTYVEDEPDSFKKIISGLRSLGYKTTLIRREQIGKNIFNEFMVDWRNA